MIGDLPDQFKRRTNPVYMFHAH
ncbi:hypothetical protein PSP6_130157 [Paraburkholderia tropica]|nr:hypothetical protein PSP6_130157 [Paraburkholderia tropica]